MTFGHSERWKHVGNLDQKEADQMIATCLDAGINFFDTADIYSEGDSERILGKALGSKRTEVIVATKCRFQMGNNPNRVGLTRWNILRACEESLKRLNTDYIDLYQVHLFDPHTPLEETLRALDDLVRQGKVLYLGCSNFTAWQLMKALATSQQLGLEKFITLQAYYSLVARELEYELIPLCLDQGLGVLPWSPLAGGFLTGKYRKGQPAPQGTRRSAAQGRFLKFDENRGYKIVEALEKIAKERNVSIAQVALNYIRQKPGITSVIIGARSQEQLEDNLASLKWELTPEEMETLDKISAPPRLYPYWMQERSARRDP
ncbi:MAG: aldo/keto reductase [Planctomycetota bacterium]|nr:MAG: aldo/keto reductase [Planctomycetota bacterium]